jgi:hypothetical protein
MISPRAACAITAIACAAPPARAADGGAPAQDAERDVQPAFLLTPAAELRHFDWSENLPSSDQQALSESGLLYGVGGAARYAFGTSRRAYVDLDLRLYFGKVDYTGRLINSGTAYTSKTAYFGLELSPTAGFVFSPARDLRVTPFGGFGFELWNRDLDDGGSKGYLEHYRVFFLQAGVRGDWLPSDALDLRLVFALKMPLVIAENVDLSRAGVQPEVNLNPGLSPRIVVEGGTTFHGVDLSLYYEIWTLLQSEPDNQFVAQGGAQLLQPTSTRQLLGVRLGYAFPL